MKLLLEMILLFVMMFIDGCQAAFTPTTNAELKAAVGACTVGPYPDYALIGCTGGCLGEDTTGDCPNFAASNDASGNPYGQIGDWDVSAVTSMDRVFLRAGAFNQDISGWDVSSATNFEFIFVQAHAFNQDLSGWDVSNAVSLRSFFNGAWAFTSDLSGWDVSSVTNFNGFMKVNDVFNSDLSSWDISSAKDLTSAFEAVTAFESDLSKWDISSVTEMRHWDSGPFGTNEMAQCTMDLEHSGGKYQVCSFGGGSNSMSCKRGFEIPTPVWAGTADDRYWQVPTWNVQTFTCDTSLCPSGTQPNPAWDLIGQNAPFDPDMQPCLLQAPQPQTCDASGPIANEDSSDSSDRTCTENMAEGASCTTKCNAGYIASNTTCTSGTLSTPLSEVCKATCATLTQAGGLLSSVCAGSAYTGALLGAADSTSCAGATCGVADAATCCEPSVSCATLSAESDPSLSSVCVAPIYTGNLVAAPASSICAGPTCVAADANTCCERAAMVDLSEHEKGSLKKLLANVARSNQHQGELLKVRYEKLACASGDQGSAHQGPAHVADISCGKYACAARLTDGSAYAWGDATYADFEKTFVDGVADISCSEYACVARMTDGSATAWGDGDRGGTRHLSQDVVDIKITPYTGVALMTDGSIQAWGSHYHSIRTSCTGSPWSQCIALPSGFVGAVALECGNTVCIAIDGAGNIHPFGNGENGAANVPSFTNPIVEVSCGQSNCIALDDDGNAKSWGSSTVPAVTLSNVAAVSCGGYACAALHDDGNAEVWGHSTFGGDEGSVDLSTENVVDISCGMFACAARKSDGTANAWGRPGYGARADTLSGVADISCGMYDCAARMTNGNAEVWGAGTIEAWVGWPADWASNIDLTNVADISCGGFACVARKNDGTAEAVGHPARGGTLPFSPFPFDPTLA